MRDAAPSWRQVLGRVNALRYGTATGMIRYRDPDGGRADCGEGWGDEPVEGVNRFWHAAPDRWRVENERGVYHVQNDEWLYVRDEGGRMQRLPRHATAWGFSVGHPWTLFGNHLDRGTLFTDQDDFSVPTGPGVAVEVAGRTAWEFVLAPPPRKPHPLRVAVDDTAGMLLRMAVPQADAYAEMVELHLDAPVPDDLFSWDGPISTDWSEDTQRRHQ